MELDNLINFFLTLNVWSVAKVFVLFALAIYACFSFIVARQVSMMTKVVSSNLNFLLKMTSVFLLAVSILVFLAALLFL